MSKSKYGRCALPAEGRRFRFRYPKIWAAVGALAIIVLSILALWWSSANASNPLSQVFNTVGVTGLTVGLVQIVMDLFVRQSIASEILQALEVRDRVNAVGISDVQSLERFEWPRIIDSAERISAYVADSQIFTTHIWPHILRRATEKQLDISLLYPEDSQDEQAVLQRVETDWRALNSRLCKKSRLRVTAIPHHASYGYIRTPGHLAILLEPVSEAVGFPSPVVHLYEVARNEEANGLFCDAIQEFERAASRARGPVYENVVGAKPEPVAVPSLPTEQVLAEDLQQLDVPLDTKE